MKRLLLAVAALVSIGGVTAIYADGEWLRTGPVWFKGLVYAGTSKVAVTNAAGNLSTTTGAFSGNVTVGGNETVTGSETVTGNMTVAGKVIASGITGAAVATGGQNVSFVTTTLTRVGTVAASGNGLTLPASAATGQFNHICHGAAANIMALWPPTGATINKESSDVYVTMSPGECASCWAYTPLQFGCTIGVAN